MFEHIKFKDTKKTLLGIHRVLVDKGKFYISVPDMDVLCKILIENKKIQQSKIHALKMMFGGQTDEYDFHYFGYEILIYLTVCLKMLVLKISKK